ITRQLHECFIISRVDSIEPSIFSQCRSRSCRRSLSIITRRISSEAEGLELVLSRFFFWKVLLPVNFRFHCI
ncbi:AAEL005692-PA, partial [Aedes aegypti]